MPSAPLIWSIDVSNHDRSSFSLLGSVLEFERLRAINAVPHDSLRPAAISARRLTSNDCADLQKPGC